MNDAKKPEEFADNQWELPATLILYISPERPWLIPSPRLVITTLDQQIAEFRLIFQADWNAYQSIKLQQLFCYAPNACGAMSSGEFVADYPVELTISLAPDWLPLLEEQAITVEQATVYFQQLNQSDPTHALLWTDSWILLSASQRHSNGTTGFRTVWDYFDWQAITQNNVPEEFDDSLLGAIINFFKDSGAHQLLAENAIGRVDQQVIETTTQLLEMLFAVAPSVVAGDQNVNQHIAGTIADLFKELLQGQISTYLEKAIAEEPIVESKASFPSESLAENPSMIAQKSTEVSTIFDSLVSFCQQENWSITQLPGQPILHLDFQGKHGIWECYAQAREEQQQLIFYSVIPVKAPQEKRQYVAEFLTRGNYGLIIGNFEFDYNDGEIRYKTSIDVKGSSLDSALIRQLVYSNVLNTDKYLPGILQIINGELSPADAIAQIEQ